MSAENKSLRAALVAAQKDAGAVSKGDRNDHSKYNYSSREVIAAHAKALLGEHGLAFGLRGPIDHDGPTGSSCFQGVLTHESGEQESWPVWWSVDYAMKGMTREQRVGTAMAYAQKNALLQLLNIPRGADDLDGDDNRHAGGGRPTQRQPPKPAEPTPQQRDTAELRALAKRAGITAEVKGDVARYLGAQYNLSPDAPPGQWLGVLRAFDRAQGIHNLIDAVIAWDSRNKADKADKEASKA